VSRLAASVQAGDHPIEADARFGGREDTVGLDGMARFDPGFRHVPQYGAAMEKRDPGRVFGEIADLYDRVRPPYPPAVFDDVLDYAGHPGEALEIGAGTGRATAAFAERGVAVTAIEPDADMAAILARRDGGRIFRGTFEDYRPDRRFGLVFSAEAWHWTVPETRWEHTRAALADGGTFALIWNNERLADSSQQRAFVDVFAELAPTVTIKDLSVTAERVWSQWPGEELAATNQFTDLTSRHYLTHQTADLAGLTQTRSQFRMLPAPAQAAVFSRLAELFGDQVPMAVDTTLLLARRL
jgi:SAM-dependent methyltransferase